MAQLPPPVHGAALRNKSLMESKLINESFDLVPLPLFFANEVKDIGKFSFRKLYLTLVYCIRLIGVLFKRKVDLAYFTMSPSGFAFYRDILIVAILRVFNVKRVYHFRIKGIRQTAATLIGRKLVKFAFKDADVICLSVHHLADIGGFNNRKAFIIPNGIKVEVNLKAPQVAVKNVPLKILFISNLGRKKGVFDLMEALSILHAEGISFACDIVGAEHDISFKELEQVLKEKKLVEKVTICGARFGSEKLVKLNEADLFVFPTCFELFPGVVLEAMQFGKAIIASTEGSIPEIIDDGVNGFLVPKQDPFSLAKKMKELLFDEGLRLTLGKKAQEKFFACFTLEQFEKRMNETFEALVRGNQRG
jgi:glycosyltransferase involved in cell wall biosynthesis